MNYLVLQCSCNFLSVNYFCFIGRWMYLSDFTFQVGGTHFSTFSTNNFARRPKLAGEESLLRGNDGECEIGIFHLT